MLSRLSSSSNHRLLKTLIGDINNNNGSCRWYSSKRQGKERLSLYSKISPLGDPTTSLTSELDGWLRQGNKLRVAELHRIIRDFRRRKRFSHALQVSEWMSKKDICAFSPVEHAVQLDLIGRVRGFLSAETYFNNLTDQDKTEKTYGALLNCYVRQRQTEKSLSHLQKMKEMGLVSSALTYNDIMCLYTNIGQYEKVPDVLTEMKRNKVSPDNFSYRICINSYGVRSDIEGMEHILKEMESQSQIVMDWNTYAVVANFYMKGGLTDKAIHALKKSEKRLDNCDGIGYNHLISLFARLDSRDEVLRIWDLKKNACKRCVNRDYITILESLVRLGDLEAAEKELKEWEASGNCYDFRVPNTVINGYCVKGLFEKAEVMLDDLMERGRTSPPNIWGKVAEGYLNKGEMGKARECMKAALSLHVRNKGWKPNPEVISVILSWLGDTGSIDDVEAFVSSLRTIMPMNRQMYHALLKANIKIGKEVEGLLSSMKADKITEDEETKEILGLRENGTK
ncbi:pentatricopeptide repeat-containing protein At4g21705, mitochondrial-like [Actinidia eriantha]|uniref:pentatricopeptide repeat-containing protein At4g21705, mitochondrial-like n=1 Tax=Actinidia eriantha TaxID=165200 RepID=UPI0025841A42|nr:pentatricopeptide repeat-containing protein At4g21705, mitochondrial-like [Actinidia eriantha]